jgi:cell division protein FtsQ
MYAELIKELDSTGAHYSQSLSEVDLSDPDDVKATVSDPKGAVLVHLGSSNFLERFQVYVAHVQEWRSQFSRLDAIDLRYAGQVIVNPENSAGQPKAAATEAQPENAPTAPKHTVTASKKAKKH